jgi:nitrate/nitrite transport system ATP-binding protein
LLSDRIIPLGAGPGASLGPATVVDIERPRDRKELNHDPRFRAIRLGVLEYLLESGKTKRAQTEASAAVQLSGSPDASPVAPAQSQTGMLEVSP